MEFLSDGWFSTLSATVAGVQLPHDRACAFEFDAGGIISHLVMEGGRVLKFAPGGLAGAELRFVWSAVDTTRLAWGTISGTDAMARTRLATEGSSVGVMPVPMGLMDRPEVATLPKIWGASIRVQFVYTAGPLGDVGYVLEFTDGLLTGERFGEAQQPDVFVKQSYRVMALLRAGQLSPLESVAGGELRGDVAAVTSLAAIFESEQFQALMMPSSDHALALATLGELRADPTFQAAFANVMSDTAMP